MFFTPGRKASQQNGRKKPSTIFYNVLFEIQVKFLLVFC